MFRIRVFILTSLFFFMAMVASPILAGGGLVEWTKLEGWNGQTSVNPGEAYIVQARVHLSNQNPYDASVNWCKFCPIKIKLDDPRPDDLFNPTSDKTDENGEVEAKIVSNISGTRTVYAEVTMPDGSIYTSSKALIYFNGPSVYPNPTIAPTVVPVPSVVPTVAPPNMIYPQDGQTLDLEGAYMFKVTQTYGAQGYLFGLFQDGQMIYENYRDEHVLSSNGEFALWDTNPSHSKFHAGPVSVWVRTLVGNKWTDARIITIYLKPRGSTSFQGPVSTPQNVIPTPPQIRSGNIITTTDASAAAALQQKVNDLQEKLDESNQKQSLLEQRLNQIISWIKSIFPFFK